MNSLQRTFPIRGWIALALFGCGVLPGDVYSQEAPPPGVRPQDAVWLVSTFALPDRACQDPCFRVFRLCSPGCWKQSNSAAFYAADDPAAVTCFYFPASRVEKEDGVQRGLKIYRMLRCAQPTAPPIRMVIWSWPNPKTMHVVEDFRIAACRADAEAFYVAYFLSRIDPRVRCSMISFSLSARIVTGSLHVLGGGQICGRRLVGNHPATRCGVRAVFWAAGVPNHWLLPGQCHGCATCALNRSLVTVNEEDRVLKRYHWSFPNCKPVALGRAGLAQNASRRAPEATGQNGCERPGGVCCKCDDPVQPKVDHFDVSALVEKSHGFDAHYQSPPLRAKTRCYALWR